MQIQRVCADFVLQAETQHSNTLAQLQSRLAELSAINADLDERNQVLMEQISGLNSQQQQLLRACEEARATQVSAASLLSLIKLLCVG